MEKILKHIITNIDIVGITGNVNVVIKGLELDSRQVEDGFLFAAIKGSQVDGHKFVDKAVEKGAVAVLCEELPEVIHSNICYVQVADASKALGEIASEFYNRPTDNIKLVGITGTNGKTTTVTLLYQLFRKLGYKVGLLSTVINYVDTEEIKATHTTPDQVRLYALLNEMVEAGCDYCFMEVSSHAVDQNRIAGLDFVGGVFSNLTHDHLDYHKTFREYLNAKKKFFDGLSKSAFALINTDDKNGMVMVQNTKAKVKTYGLKNLADYKVKIVESHFEGMELLMDNVEFWTSFIGSFNAYNLMAVYSTAIELNQDKQEVLTVLSSLKSVDGRFETIQSENGKTAVVDYAHTPDALENVLSTIDDIRKGSEKLITVVGAGGDRDKTKRPLMAAIAAKYSDRVILTSDNPRTEDPNAILDDMKQGLDKSADMKTLVIADRKEAIKTSVVMAEAGDIILIAGKGHETYQEVNGVKNHFDDREIVREYFNL